MKNKIAIREFTVTEARPLPVILLLDSSGSMGEDGKIEVLDEAVTEMLSAFASEPDLRAAIHVAAISFGREVRAHLPLLPAESAGKTWRHLVADGGTPLGPTLTKLRMMLEDKTMIPSRSYRPTLVLISDGEPDEGWEIPLKQFLESERASKATRMAMAIGAGANVKMLQRFLNSPEAKVFQGHQARDILKFFKWVTMSVTVRSRSTTPNQFTPIAPLEIDEIDY